MPESPAIFVVDERPELADLAGALLASEGFRVWAYRDRLRAWRAFVLADPRPTLLITDDLGGEMSGIELIRRCKLLEPGLKALWVSHHSVFSLARSDRDLLDWFQSRLYCGTALVQAVRQLLVTKPGPAPAG